MTRKTSENISEACDYHWLPTEQSMFLLENILNLRTVVAFKLLCRNISHNFYHASKKSVQYQNYFMQQYNDSNKQEVNTIT